MLKTPLHAGGCALLACLLLCGTPAVPARAGSPAKPYVEKTPGRGFHIFVRPKYKTPEAQWEFAQHLDQIGKWKSAARMALALRIWWPHSPEGPKAQMFYARLMDRHHKYQEAFDAYQYLLEHYTGRFEFNEILDRQMQIAKTLMELKKGKFLFLPGFDAPERAIPLFEKIVASAPEGRWTAEAYYLTGVANERIYEYDQAIDAYFTALNRFPGTEFADKSAYSQAQCHIKISNDAPHDNRALETARAACLLFLERYPGSVHRAEIEADLANLHERRIAIAYQLALYYDRILRKPAAALIEYQTFVALFPDAEQTPAARLRIEQLRQATPAQEN
jgi:outer membrane protein assembly factor BamD